MTIDWQTVYYGLLYTVPVLALLLAWDRHGGR